MRRTMYWGAGHTGVGAGEELVEEGGEGALGFADVLAGQRRWLWHGVTPVLGAEQGLQGADEVASLRALGPSDRCGELLLESVDDGDGALGDVDAVVGEAELDGAGVGGVPGPLDQAGLLEGPGELGDEDRFQARPVGQLPLARLGSGSGKAVEGRKQGVLGVGQAERVEDPVDARAQLGGEPPEQVAGGGVLGRSRHGS